MRKTFDLPFNLIQRIIDGKKHELRVPVYDDGGNIISVKADGRVKLNPKRYARSIPFAVGDKVVVSKRAVIRITDMTMDVLKNITSQQALEEGAYLVGENSLHRYEFNNGKVSHITPQDAVIHGLYDLYGIEAGSPVVVYKFKLIMSPVRLVS